MIKRSLRRMMPLLAALALVLPSAGYSEVLEEKPSALAMFGDAVFARPVLLTTTVVGSAIYVVSLPFSLAGGNAKEAAETLVMGPAKATFVRCLGCTKVGRKKEVIFTGE
ncbi:MAG: hypothetical protein D6758_07635 [Gammaproteobacteria bacterium]|nr:MAG: hypothetical protein D6758_07635 [Gammaproteobacteria bacterium]